MGPAVPSGPPLSQGTDRPALPPTDLGLRALRADASEWGLHPLLLLLPLVPAGFQTRYGLHRGALSVDPLWWHFWGEDDGVLGTERKPG